MRRGGDERQERGHARVDGWRGWLDAKHERHHELRAEPRRGEAEGCAERDEAQSRQEHAADDVAARRAECGAQTESARLRS